MNFTSQLLFAEHLPPDADFQRDLLIIDSLVALQKLDLAKKFRYVYRVTAGEALKNFSEFPARLDEILSLWKEPLHRRSRIIACGGGSVGDFAGFVASILKRGVLLTQCPSTWLAAIDSAHGGKTALNYHGVKNQIGTFYPAHRVWLVQDILRDQGDDRARDAMGELLKISLTASPPFFTAVVESQGLSFADTLWKFLRPAIAAKYSFIEKDPYETLGPRKILNLGHTLGHVLEAHHGWSHGASVLAGLRFAVEWSAHRGDLSAATAANFREGLEKLGLTDLPAEVSPLSSTRARQLVLQDKKLNELGCLDFVFLKSIGEAQVVAVPVDDFLTEARRQGWVRDVDL